MSKRKPNKKTSEGTGKTVFNVLAAVVILVIAIVLVIVLVNIGENKGSQPAPTPAADDGEGGIYGNSEAFPFTIPGFTFLDQAEIGALDGNLELLGVGRYTGAYFEDGSDEDVMDVYAIVVRNNGEDWVDFAVITLSCGGKTATFELSALPGGTSALVLEANRLTFTEGDVPHKPHAVCTDDTTPHIFTFDDVFEIYPSDGVINIKNVSQKRYQNDILVYYKNYDYGLFLGGITYRARFAGLEPQQIGQSIQPHYSDALSLILFLSYDD